MRFHRFAVDADGRRAGLAVLAFRAAAAMLAGWLVLRLRDA
jgi:hypothetical protein